MIKLDFKNILYKTHPFFSSRKTGVFFVFQVCYFVVVKWLWLDSFSVTVDLASFGLPNLSKIAREGKAAAELAETAEDAKEIRRVAEKANRLIETETGKDVAKMSNKEYDDFFYYLSKWEGRKVSKIGYLGAKKLNRKEIKECIKKINVISEGESKLIIHPEGHKLLNGNKAGFNPFSCNLYVQKA